jgi:ribonuclease PH
MALLGCDKLFAAQREALELPYPGVLPQGPPPPKAFGS